MGHEDKKSIPRRQSKLKAKNSETLTQKQQIEVESAIRAAIIQYQQQIEQERVQQKAVDLETIDSILSEYIGPYILIGFNLNNDPIEIFSAKNALEAAALFDHLKKVFLEKAVRHGTGLM